MKIPLQYQQIVKHVVFESFTIAILSLGLLCRGQLLELLETKDSGSFEMKRTYFLR